MVALLQPDVMTLAGKCGRKSAMVCQGDPGAEGPVVDSRFLAAKSGLKPIAVLSDVMQ